MIQDGRDARSLKRLSCMLAPLGLCLAMNAHGAWVTEVGGRVDSRYDDNVRLTTDSEEEDAVVTSAGGELRLRRVTEKSELAAVIGGSYLMYTAYDGVEDLPNEDIEYADVRARTSGERIEFGFNGSVRRDVLLKTVGFIVDPLGTPSGEQGGATPSAPLEPPAGPITGDDSSDVDAASVERQVRRIRTRASPYMNYQLSETTGIWLGYDYLGLDYDDESATGLDDSKTNAVSGGVRSQLNERDAARIGLRAARFDPQSGPDKTDAYEASIGWDHTFSQVTRGGIELGVQRSERDNDSNTGYLGRLYLFRRADNGALRVSFEHSLQPSAYGDVVEADTVNMAYSRAFSARWGMRVQARGYRTRNVSDQISSQSSERDYADAGPTLTYALTRSVEVGAFYRYRWVDRENEGSGSSNAFGLSISYQSPRDI